MWESPVPASPSPPTPSCRYLEKTGKTVSGSIKLDGEELVGCGEKRMKTVRGNRVSIIFQDPMTSLNPTYTIGHQLMEAILLHTEPEQAAGP